MLSAMTHIRRIIVGLTRDAISFMLYLFMARRKRAGTVVLVYHSVGKIDPSTDAYRLNITPERFEEHLKVISNSRDLVKITFDDGYGNNFENAFPLLRKYGLTATIFVITDFIDGVMRSGEFCGKGLNLRPLAWEEMKAMDSAGITFGSHTKTHPVLTALAESVIAAELQGSKRRIETALGHVIDSLSYPFGNRSSFDPIVKKIAAESGYGHAYTNIMGANSGDYSDKFALKRVRIYSEDGPLKLKMKLKGAYDWIDAF